MAQKPQGITPQEFYRAEMARVKRIAGSDEVTTACLGYLGGINTLTDLYDAVREAESEFRGRVVWTDEENHDRVHVVNGRGEKVVVDRSDMLDWSPATGAVYVRWLEEEHERVLQATRSQRISMIGPNHIGGEARQGNRDRS